MKKPTLLILKKGQTTGTTFNFEDENSLIGYMLSTDYPKKNIMLVSVFGETYVTEYVPLAVKFVEMVNESLKYANDGYVLDVTICQCNTIDEAFNLGCYMKKQFKKMLKKLQSEN
jgi:hypothetical protein